MRIFFAVLFAFLLALPPTEALGQQPPIITQNPAQYVTDVSNLMSRSGMRPVRDIYMQMFPGVALPANVEGTLIVYERVIGTNQASIARTVEDTSLSGTFRSIYSYHYFGANGWLFTRFDFVKISDAEWALSALSFSSEWGQVALPTTPGFTAAPVR